MNAEQKRESIEILLVEDDSGDVELIREALAANGLAHVLHVASDGVEAIDFLRRRGDFADAPRPDLVLLDLNMPRKGGHEVLLDIKADPDLRVIPIIVLTTSESETDVAASYAERANAFITKPVDFDRFVDAVRQIDDFYLQSVVLPKQPRKPES